MLKVLCFLLFGLTFSVYAQTPEDSVKQVINRFFEGMKTSDTAMIRQTISPSLIFQTVTQKGPKMESLSAFLASVSKSKKGELDEQITFESIKTDGDLCSVWTPYIFYYQGKLSHCGANSFQLVRQSGLWKIQYVIDTRRKQNCEPR